MTQGSTDGARYSPDDAHARLMHDWLSVLLRQFIRAAGLLEPDHAVSGDRVSLSEWFALAELADAAPLAQRDLSERLDLEKSTVSRLVAGLEQRGLVTRQRNPGNRRYYQVTLTEHGRMVLRTLASQMLERHARIFAVMTAEERQALATGLTALVRAMDETPPVVD